VQEWEIINAPNNWGGNWFKKVDVSRTWKAGSAETAGGGDGSPGAETFVGLLGGGGDWLLFTKGWEGLLGPGREGGGDSRLGEFLYDGSPRNGEPVGDILLLPWERCLGDLTSAEETDVEVADELDAVGDR